MDISWGMLHDVGWETQGELDDYAQPIMVHMGTIKARVNHSNKLVRNADGIEVMSNIQVHVFEPVNVGDKITVTEQTYRVISVRDGLPLYGNKMAFRIVYL